MKVETHNHPTAISPHPGGYGLGAKFATKARRAVQAKAGSPDLCLKSAPTGRCDLGDGFRSGRIASALDIMLEDPSAARPST